MKLLIITQKVDINDPILGFFHNWVIELAKKFEKISVICLEKGNYDLPNNVKVYSLGKEIKYESRFMKYELCKKARYIFQFFNLCFFQSLNYDAVFVHMNQEYVLLGGFIWKILRKKIYFWRNHQIGNSFTRMAVWFADKVFCTSKFAFVAKYKKTEIMPVGVDIEIFKDLKMERLEENKNKILFLGRMDSIKKPDLLINALNILEKNNTDFVCNFYGDPTPNTGDYYESLKKEVEKSNLREKVNFYKAVPNYETPKIYNEHNIFVNLTSSGSFDKTILEAGACGCLLVITNKTLAGEIDEKMIAEEIPENIAEKINFWLNAGTEETKNASQKLQNYTLENHSLNALISRIEDAFKK